MGKIIDIKPKSGSIIDTKPIAGRFSDIKPTMLNISGETETYYDVRYLRKGQAIGLLLALTYSEDTVISVART